MKDTHTQRQRHRQRENQAPRGELDVELCPRTPGSQPEPKADAQTLSHPWVPISVLFFFLTWIEHRHVNYKNTKE